MNMFAVRETHKLWLANDENGWRVVEPPPTLSLEDE
jgi:hypothetical protein